MRKTVLLLALLLGARGAYAAPAGAGFYDTSEYLAGKVAVAIIYPESTGSTENWSTDRKAEVYTEIVSAMEWWAARNSAAHLSFVYVTETVSTSYEPITCNAVGTGGGACPNGEEDWIKEIMGTINSGAYAGYSDYYDRVYKYNADIRDANNADWAFTFFVADSYNDADGKFADGYFAYAYIGGPFSVMTYDNENYGIGNMEAVAAHEMGHIFYALDEYAESSCATSEHSGYLNGYNTNCENGGTGYSCIMRGGVAPYNNDAICNATAKQLGWSDLDPVNGKLDVLDLPPNTDLTPYSPDPTSNTSLAYSGTAYSTQAYTNSNTYDYFGVSRTGTDICINRVASVEYKVDSGSWQSATAQDGAFDSNSENFFFTASGLSASHTVYARAKDIFNAYDETPASDGVTVDAGQAEDIPYVYDGTAADVDYTRNTFSVSANWGESSHASGINRYEYAIGSSAGGNEVFGWQTAGTARSVTRTGLSLSEGVTYYFSVKAYPNAGDSYVSGATTSDGFRVDKTSPTAHVIVTSSDPAPTGSFSAKLVVTEANDISGTPQLSFTASDGLVVPLTMSFLTGSTWTASGNIESYHSTGTATFSMSASDMPGNTGTQITSGGTFQVDHSIAGASGGSVSNSDGMTVVIPAGAYAGTLFVSVSTVAASQVSSADSASSESRKIYSTDMVREFSARDVSGSDITSFSSPVTITMAYQDADSDGRMDTELYRETSAWIYYLDTAQGKWTPVEGLTRDTAANTLTVQVPHFSVYSIRAAGSNYPDIGGLKAYPNPCDFRSVAALTIAGVPVDAENTKAYLYNEAGELVRTLSRSDGINSLNVISWDGRDSKGRKAASGIYIYLVKTSNYGKGRGKVFLIW